MMWVWKKRNHLAVSVRGGGSMVTSVQLRNSYWNSLAPHPISNVPSSREPQDWWPVRSAIGWCNFDSRFHLWWEVELKRCGNCFSCLPPGCDNGSILPPILASVGRNILGLPSLQPLIYLLTIGIQNNQNSRPPGTRSWWQSVRDPSIVYLIIIH